MAGAKSFVVIVSKADLSIVNVYQSSAPTPHLYGTEWGNLEKYSHISVPENMDIRGVICARNEAGEIVLETDSKKLDSVMIRRRQEAWVKIRARRNQLLRMSDWVVSVPDATNVNEEKKALWIQYRQQLRDLPSTHSDPDNVQWPKAPA